MRKKCLLFNQGRRPSSADGLQSGAKHALVDDETSDLL
jgi:hypothetical protein